MKTNNLSLNQKNLEDLMAAFDHYFPEGTIYVSDKPFFSGDFNWNNRDDFIKFINKLIQESGVVIASQKDIQHVREAQRELVKLVGQEEKTTLDKVESNTVSPEQLKQFEKEAKEREDQQKQADINAKRDIEASIKKQQEIYAQAIRKAKVEAAILRAEEKKVYYKVEEAPTELNQQAEADPKQFVEDATKQFEKSAAVQNLSPEEAHIVSEQAALTTYEVFRGNSPAIQTTILKRVIADDNIDKNLKDIASILIDQKTAQYELVKQFVNLPENINVEFSDTPKEGFKEFDLLQIPTEHLQNLNDQNNFLRNFNVADLGEKEIRSQILLNIGTRIESHMATLPAGSAMAQFYKTESVQFALQTLGVVETAPLAAVEGSLIGKLAIGSGLGNVANFIQVKTGINLGVKLAVKAAVTTGTEAVTGAAVGAAAGSVVPVAGNIIGAIIGFIGTEVIGKIAKKVPWQKLKKIGPAIAGVTIGLPAIVITGSIGTGVLLGGGAAAGTALLTGGWPALQAGLSSAFSGLSIAGGVIWKTFLSGIAVPILVTLLVFPVIVALILFIINSGAYVVPLGSGDRSRPPPIGGLVSSCKESDETGADITAKIASEIKNGSVNLLPETVWGRRDGICITPTMIVMHWSAGTNDNPSGNERTYETLVQRSLSCQLATDTNDTWIMERFFEKQVEFPACAGEYNTYAINNEMAGVYFTDSPPPPNTQELELTYNATCKVMKQYNIPWSQIYGHYQVPNSGKDDPGKDFLEKVFIPEIKKRCPNGN
ncbi:MAG TPA: N-acetylmuramoyl-L-alanine amidase [Alphaproteobacteria bacterium]|jgi:hypothetical protein|nr:N-acetylmuramoyl-L-alanine amidase [Alphaproteobacteria bacterium]